MTQVQIDETADALHTLGYMTNPWGLLRAKAHGLISAEEYSSMMDELARKFKTTRDEMIRAIIGMTVWTVPC